MIVTLPLDPAIDQGVFVHRLALGEVNRYCDSCLDPAGRGINVSRMAHRLNWPATAVGFLTGRIGLIVRQARCPTFFLRVRA